MQSNGLKLVFLVFLSTTLLTLCPNPVRAHELPSVEFSGFGRLIAGISNKDHNTTLVYDTDLSIKPDSLIGIQADWQLASHWTATAQIIGHLDDDKNSGLEWLYLSYQPIQSTKLKIGRLRTPFFSYSDVIDVGYAYHWITPPNEVYASYLFTNYDGASVVHNINGDNLTASIEAYIGRFSDHILQDGRMFDTSLNYIGGLSIKIAMQKLTLSASYNRGDIEKSEPLFQSTFAQLRELFETQQLGHLIDDIEVVGNFTFAQLGFSYDSYNYFIKGERTRFSHNFDLMPEIKSFYLSSGYQFQDYLFHLTWAKRSDRLSRLINQVPDPSQLAPLRDIYQGLIDGRVSSEQKSITLGVRWDLSPNIALKSDISKIHYPLTISQQHFDATTLLLGLEWIF